MFIVALGHIRWHVSLGLQGGRFRMENQIIYIFNLVIVFKLIIDN